MPSKLPSKKRPVVADCGDLSRLWVTRPSGGSPPLWCLRGHSGGGGDGGGGGNGGDDNDNDDGGNDSSGGDDDGGSGRQDDDDDDRGGSLAGRQAAGRALAVTASFRETKMWCNRFSNKIKVTDWHSSSP